MPASSPGNRVAITVRRALTAVTVAVVASALLLVAGPAGAKPKAAAAPNWTFVWGDAFDGSYLNTSKWGALEGKTSPGTDQVFSSEMVSVANGNLDIKTAKQQYGSRAYTSGMVWTKGRFAFTYGKIDIRAKMPVSGSGIWPALWLQGLQDYNWPGPGGNEIDINEMWNNNTDVHMALHYADTPNGTDLGANQGCTWKSPTALSADFHTYTLVWQPGPILTYYVDNIQRCQFSPTGNYFNTPMYIIMNTAIGASWIGHPDASTPFPQHMYIDSVRVYQDSNLS